MPSTITHTPAETERKEPGIGGKPPVDRRPTGGGGGGGDDDGGRNRAEARANCFTRVRFFVFFGSCGRHAVFCRAGRSSSSRDRRACAWIRAPTC